MCLDTDLKSTKKWTENLPSDAFLLFRGLKLRETKCVGLIKPKPGEHDDMDGFL